ncbi:chromosome segregation protein SMC [Kocuria sediminis]|uniref:Chromosome partition protein Smc n=1 Tax=Kocuria sediminis TaxID=1038857 RepID=A0A6N8GFZ7_9MICC|nr:chromosome segregation protein SMC [Kocuria sediminis]
MHLKTLTVRGFKSFASATTFEFEPGVTAVVGPNGSGKSNVVDALSWVMGEQGAKSLRGGKMEDVIFAGTAGRAPLGRAHVALTIDNADGALPIEYSEVTIARTLFRSGGSEYAINGRACRLLDIQELLSDSGLGREMHVIVGQGQLDRILHATPEERRGFVEEASGILKHRRRKERTLRKLEAMQANLDRLEDLTAEIRRQLTPLGRQARVARRAQRIQHDVRDARARLLADDLVRARTSLAVDEDLERRLRAERAQAEQDLDAGRARQSDVEARAARATPALNAARDTWYQLTAVQERYRSLASLAAERRRLLGPAAEPAEPARDPDRLAAQAARTRAEQDLLLEQVEDATDGLAAAIEDREAAEAAARAQDAVVTGLLRAAADRREGLARLTGAVAAARSRVEAAENELARLHGTRAEAGGRRERAGAEADSLALASREAAGAADRARAEHEAADAAAGTARAAAREAEAAAQELLRAHDAQRARAETLRAALRQPDGSTAVRERHADAVLGAVVDLVGVEPGWERAVTAALGPLAEALAVRSHGAAVSVFEALRGDGVGRVHLLVADGAGPGEVPVPPEVLALAGVRPAAAVLGPGAGGADDDARRGAAAVRALLVGTVLTEDAATAARAVAGRPGLTAVTRDGDVFTAATAWGGAAEAAGTLETRAAAERAEQEQARLAAALERARAAARAAGVERDAGRRRAQEAAATLRAAERSAERAASELSRVRAVLDSAAAETGRFEEQVAAADRHLAAEQHRLREVADRLQAAEELGEEDTEDAQLEAAARREELHRAATAARAAETEARLALRSLEEQARALGNRAASQERAAAAERRAREEAERRAHRRRLQARNAEAVLAAAEQLLVRVEASVAAAAGDRDRAEAVRAGLDAELTELRGANDRIAARVAELTDSVHRDELARTQQRTRIEALEARSLEELGLTPDALVEHYGPHLPIPDPDAGTGTEEPEDAADGQDALFGAVAGAPFVRAEQERRLRRAEKELASLGRVNPLALEEFAALEERHRFLAEQLEDLKRSRQDLRSILREVDEHVERVFTEAYADTAREFEGVFATLFPGGEGRLRLTDPTDMLSTGIDVEARPAGKKIKRLSLLSGGERSLTAIALLVAIFKARPSPFYVMDEVEAALDDRNLGRLLSIFRQLQETSQLIIITHQKRTMEIADALYGVAMRGDGVTTVIGQRLAELR